MQVWRAAGNHAEASIMTMQKHAEVSNKKIKEDTAVLLKLNNGTSYIINLQIVPQFINPTKLVSKFNIYDACNSTPGAMV